MGKRRYTAELETEIVKLYRQGLSIREIADQMGIPPLAPHPILRRSGVSLRSRGGSHKGIANGAAKLTEADVSQIRQEADEGKSQAAIARRFGVTRQMISRVVLRRNWNHVG
jgi:IS30 family transposase